MQKAGVIATCFLLNFMGILVNGLSMINILKLQHLTFVCFLFSKASIFSSLYAFLLGKRGCCFIRAHHN